MRYCNTVTVDDVVFNNLKEFIKGKKPVDDLFERINVTLKIKIEFKFYMCFFLKKKAS